MKTLHLSIIITGIGITTFVVIGIFVLFNPSLIDESNTLCSTKMIVLYGEPAKYNQTIILNALRDNLSKDNFRNLNHLYSWWQYVDIQPRGPDTFSIQIPSADEKTINMTKSIISKIDGVEKIGRISTECISAPVGGFSLVAVYEIMSLITAAIGAGMFFRVRGRK